METLWIFLILNSLIMTSLMGRLHACPADISRRAQQCFTDLAKGVAGSDDGDDNTSDTLNDLTGGGGGGGDGGGGGVDGVKENPAQQAAQSVSRAMPLDYRKIREYCSEDGHMNRFVQCVEGLLQECPDLPQEGALRQLINPQRVRTSVPNLCNSVDKVEAGSECMNREMNRRSACKERAYDMVKAGMVQTASNITAMFYVQCRFFSVLAECQRKAVSENCGGNLGDLHADFLLSFVPNTCIKDISHDLQQDQGQTQDIRAPVGQDGPVAKDDKPPEDLRQSKGHGDEQVKGKVKMPKVERQRSPTLTRTTLAPQSGGGFQQVLKTLPPKVVKEMTPKTALTTDKPRSSQSKVVTGSSAGVAPSSVQLISCLALSALAAWLPALDFNR